MQRWIDGCQMNVTGKWKQVLHRAIKQHDPRTCRGVHTEIHFVRVQRTVPKKKNLNPYTEIRILKKVSNILQSIFKRKNQKVKMTNLQTNLHVGGDDEMIPFHC